MKARIKTIDPDEASPRLVKDWIAGKSCVYPIQLYPPGLFELTLSNGYKILCFAPKCAHLGGGEWQILTDEEALDYQG